MKMIQITDLKLLIDKLAYIVKTQNIFPKRNKQVSMRCFKCCVYKSRGKGNIVYLIILLKNLTSNRSRGKRSS